MYDSYQQLLSFDDDDLSTNLIIEYFSSINERILDEINQNLDDFKEQELNPDTHFSILIMVNEILTDEEEGDQKIVNLKLMVSYLDNLFRYNESINEYYNDEKLNNLKSMVLYLLPYAANFFSQTNEIFCFECLFSLLLSIIDKNGDEIIQLFNKYIKSLLNKTPDYHKMVITLYFASEFKILEENRHQILFFLSQIIENLPEVNLDDHQAKLFYEVLFKDMNLFLSKSLIYGDIDLHFFIQSIDQYMVKCIGNASIELIESIIQFCIHFVKTYRINLEGDLNQDNQIYFNFVIKISEIIYVNLYTIIKLSESCLSSLASEFLSISANFLNLDLVQTDFDYFIQLVCQLIPLQISDVEEIKEAEECFFYDFYDIDLKSDTFYSSRQSLSSFIYKLTDKSKDVCFIQSIINLLNEIKEDDINEDYFYLLSILNSIVLSFPNCDESIMMSLTELTHKSLFIGKQQMNQIFEKNKFESIENQIFIFTFYFFIWSSFDFFNRIENDDIYFAINEEVERIIGIDDNCEFIRTFFTFYFIIINKLFDCDSLIVHDQEKFCLFITNHYNLCYTNDGMNFLKKYSVLEENKELFMDVFDEYMNKSIQFMVMMSENERFKYFEDKESYYIKRYFNETVSKMSNIIREVGFDSFDGEKILDFYFSMFNFDEEEWLFYKECIELMSAILSSTSNLTDISAIYFDSIENNDNFVFIGECLIPFICALSNNIELVDQNYIDFLIFHLKNILINSTDNNIYNLDHRSIPTDDALVAFSLASRIFEFGISDKIHIDDEHVSFFIEFANEIQPTEGDCLKYDAFNQKEYDIGLVILNLAIFLVNSPENKEEIIEFLENINNNGLIVCQEMRYVIVFLINNILGDYMNNDLNIFKNLCISNETQKNDFFVDLYIEKYDFLVGIVKHPVFQLYVIENFMYDK